MSNKVNKIYTWMSEITGESPKAFNEFFYSDIMDYVFPDNFDDIEELADETFLSTNMRAKLLACPTKEAVKTWMNEVASIIIMKIDTEQIISDHLA
jgi:hypothetical protein